MKINPRKLDIAMANLCLTTRDLQKLGRLSRTTIAKMRNDSEYIANPKTIGKIAKALNVTVEELTVKEGDD